MNPDLHQKTGFFQWSRNVPHWLIVALGFFAYEFKGVAADAEQVFVEYLLAAFGYSVGYQVRSRQADEPVISFRYGQVKFFDILRVSILPGKFFNFK